jgi:hypothetical protein
VAIKRPKRKIPDPMAPGGSGIRPLARIDPFTTAIYLPGRKQLLTFGPSGPLPGPGFAVKWYSVPDFKLLGSRTLPRPVLHAAVNETSGRLFVATVNRGPSGFDAREQLHSVGDVQAYDLAQVLAADSKDELKPVASFKADARLSDLELSPDGSLLYTSTATHPGPGKKPTARLLKLDASKLTMVAELELEAPVLGVRLSPDGKTLLALEHPFNAFGVPAFGRAINGEVLIADAGAMKRIRRVPVQGLPADVRFLDNQRALAVVVFGLRPRLFEVTLTGNATDVTPPNGLRAPQAGFLGVAPPAKRIVTSARIPGTTGTEVFEMAAGSEPPRSLAAADILPNALFAGPVVLTPDGRFAIYGTGAVLDLSDVGK